MEHYDFAADVDGDSALEFVCQVRSNYIARRRLIVFDWSFGTQTETIVDIDEQMDEGIGADLNGDGQLDLLIRADQDLLWIENGTRDGRAWLVRAGPIGGGETARVGNLNDDDLIDVVSTQGLFCNNPAGSGASILGNDAEINITGRARIRTSRVDVRAGSSLSATAGVQIEPNATLAGSGQVVGDVDNGGVVAPLLGQTLTITGGLSQTLDDPTLGLHEGELRIDLGGTTGAPTMLRVTGAATLGGMLRVVADASFDPPIGAVFEVLNAGGLTGTFANEILPSLPCDRKWRVFQDAGSSGGESVYLSFWCKADLTTQGAGIGDPGYGEPDGAVSGADLNYYVNAWVLNDESIADLTTQGAPLGHPDYCVPDGMVSGIDIQHFVNLWFAGCP